MKILLRQDKRGITEIEDEDEDEFDINSDDVIGEFEGASVS
jgi:hypothetical protein